ncbi:MAG: hypothetical protein CUN55_05900 [Phototrophicales bacterium]|nr:MAG: hypothetical protein CUN55_05900 [Phototrophicales bacterium]
MPQIEDSPRRVRVKFNGEIIADSKRMKLMLGRHPVYFFPQQDVHMEFLTPTDRERNDSIGHTKHWTVTVNEKSAINAAYTYTSFRDETEGSLDGYLTFTWREMDAWYEEAEEIFGHPRSPYHRVDVRRSDRHVRVVIDGVTVAETTNALFLFETGIRTRYYIPQEDIRMDLLSRTDTQTICPYKGFASYWSVTINGNVYEDIVWAYEDPFPEASPIKGALSFYNEKLDIYVDGVLEDK